MGFQGAGAELRGNGAIDLAVWDLLGKAAGLPLTRLLGGPVRTPVPIYNTCAGSGYIRDAARQSSDNWGWFSNNCRPRRTSRISTVSSTGHGSSPGPCGTRASAA